MRKKVKLIDGREVKEAMGSHKLSLHTYCIRKWAVVDLETGEMLACNGGRSAWGGRRPRLDIASPEVITLVKKIANEYEAIQQAKKDKQAAEHAEMMRKMRERARNETRTVRFTMSTSANVMTGPITREVVPSDLPYPYSSGAEEMSARLAEINQGAIEEAVRAESMPEMSLEIDSNRGHPVACEPATPPPSPPVVTSDFELTAFSAVSVPTDPVARVSSPSSVYESRYARPVAYATPVSEACETAERPDHRGPRGSVTNPCAEIYGGPMTASNNNYTGEQIMGAVTSGTPLSND